MLLEIEPIIAPPTIGADGTPVPGDVLDPRYHVNAAWHGVEPSAAFRQAEMTPGTPNRSFATPTQLPPIALPMPAVIPAWKGLAWLEQAVLLDAAAAVADAPAPRSRDSPSGMP